MKKQSTSTGTSICTVLFLIFLVLKLAEIGAVANWSWWAVTAPLWIPIILVIVIAAIVIGVTYISRHV